MDNEMIDKYIIGLYKQIDIENPDLIKVSTEPSDLDNRISRLSWTRKDCQKEITTVHNVIVYEGKLYLAQKEPDGGIVFRNEDGIVQEYA